MLRVSRILRDYTNAGPLNSLIGVWGFVDDHTFLTKAGDVGVVYRLAGVDFECLDAEGRRDLVHRFESAVRVLDDDCRVYQYLVRRRIAPLEAPPCGNPHAADAIRRRVEHLNGRRAGLYDISLFLVLMYEGLRSRLLPTRPSPRGVLDFLKSHRASFSTTRTTQRVTADIDRAVADLHHRADAFAVHLADTLQLQRLHKTETFRFLRSLVNYHPDKAAATSLTYDTHVDYFMADSPVECHRDHLDIDGVHVRVLTMKEPPTNTFAHVLEGLYTLPGEFIACLEWRRLPVDRVRRDLQRRRRHFFNRRVSLINYLGSQTRPEDMLVDDSAGAVVRQLGDALTEIEVNGHFFGECALTLVLLGDEPRAVVRMSAEASKVMGSHDASFMEETYNLLNAWLAVIPGNRAHNLRRLALLETNYADLSFLFTLDTGRPTCPHLERDALAVFETRHQTPYRFALHAADVGHTLILGATGTGKSFLLNFLITQAQQYDPFTVIFDLGHSYRGLTSLLHGSYLELNLRQREVTINPFALAPTPEHQHFLHAFTRVLVEGHDEYRLNDGEHRELYEAIENLYVLDASQRRLFTLGNLLPRALATRLAKWTEGGQYGALFDHVDDTFSVQPLQVLDLQAMAAYPELLEPLIFYVLHRVTALVQDPTQAARLKLCIFDEAWRFIQHERIRAYVHEALKTWRKHNAAMLLATQTVDDFASVDLLRTVIESCPTKLLLANPSLDRATYRTLLTLNETELDLLRDLIPRRQFLMKRPGLAKVLTLTVESDAVSLDPSIASGRACHSRHRARRHRQEIGADR